MFNTGLIDSLKIRVKLDKVKLLDKRLITDYIAYYPSIEKLDNDGNENDRLGDDYRKAEPYTKIQNGITYRFYIKAFIDKNKVSQEYVVFQISAKMLKEKYFEGITAFNYHTIVDDINSFGVLKISKTDFLQGLVSDIDICINQLIDLKSVKTAFSFIMHNPNQGKLPLIHPIEKSKEYTQRFDKHNFSEKIFDEQIMYLKIQGKNLGLDFNKREKASNSAPYCKIYHKGFELLSKSIIFYKAYLEPMKASVIDNLVRYEFTIKAHKHKEFLCKQGLKADFKTFFDLLKAKPQDLKLIAQTGLKWYIEPKSKKSNINQELNPMDVMIQFYQSELIKLGFPEDRLLGFSHSIDCPVSRSRTKTKAKKILDDLKNRDKNLKKQIEQNDISNNFLKNLGYE
jgi:hypothetical protein